MEGKPDGSVPRSVQHESLSIDVGLVYKQARSRLKKASSGKITIGSGAGESVCLASMVPEEKACRTAKTGTSYKVVGGQTFVSRSEKNARFTAGETIGSLRFQAVDEVKTPFGIS